MEKNTRITINGKYEEERFSTEKLISCGTTEMWTGPPQQELQRRSLDTNNKNISW
jgi:hypothetical protein